jgi:uncharacterized HAD superfamily protein
MVPASMIALLLNRPLADLQGFLDGRIMGHGRTRQPKYYSANSLAYTRLLLVDDCVGEGISMQRAKQQLESAFPNADVVCLAVYAPEEGRDLVDIHLDVCGYPRAFEWNLLHFALMESACLDLEVIGRQSSDFENDGESQWEQAVSCSAMPTGRVRRIVTSQPEKYRNRIEGWLRNMGVEYGSLDMLDLANVDERRRTGIYASFKAEVYVADQEAVLFIENDPQQAKEIGRLSGRPVLDFTQKCLVDPTPLSVGFYSQKARGLRKRIRRVVSGLQGTVSKRHAD